MARSFLCFFAALLLLTGSALAGGPGVQRGAGLFNDKGCAHCHGINGIGGSVGPDLAKVRERLNAGQITDQIRNGGKAMPAFGDVLSSSEVADLVDYLRSKHKPGKPVNPGHVAAAPAR